MILEDISPDHRIKNGEKTMAVACHTMTSPRRQSDQKKHTTKKKKSIFFSFVCGDKIMLAIAGS